MNKMISLDPKELKKALSRMEEFDEDRFFKYLESLVDTRKFNNTQKWLDRKGYRKIEEYRREEKIKIKAMDQESLNKLNKESN
ncbi:hypothetical protein ES705_16778 [subsurface metagenome]